MEKAAPAGAAVVVMNGLGLVMRLRLGVFGSREETHFELRRSVLRLGRFYLSCGCCNYELNGAEVWKFKFLSLFRTRKRKRLPLSIWFRSSPLLPADDNLRPILTSHGLWLASFLASSFASFSMIIALVCTQGVGSLFVLWGLGGAVTRSSSSIFTDVRLEGLGWPIRGPMTPSAARKTQDPKNPPNANASCKDLTLRISSSSCLGR